MPYPGYSLDMNDSEPAPGRAPLDPARWVDAYGDVLYRFALARVRDAATAQDLVQETFLAALKGRSGYGGRSSERTWLTGILKNKIIDHYRKSSRVDLINDLAALKGGQDRLFDEDGHWLIHEPTAPREWNASQSASLDRDEFWRKFHECADKLPEQARKVFLLREVDAVDSGEICRSLKISPNNFWVIMHRARSALRQCLEMNWFAQA